MLNPSKSVSYKANVFSGTPIITDPDAKIYVHPDMYNSYLTYTGWSSLSSKILSYTP